MFLWGNFLQKNIATFRCYGNISQAKYFAPPHPFKNSLAWGLTKRADTTLTDSRREVKPRFGCRYFVGATETLQNKKVVLRWYLKNQKAIHRSIAELPL